MLPKFASCFATPGSMTVQAIERGRVRRKCGVFIKSLEAKDNGVWELIVHRNPRGGRTFRPITKRMDLSP